MVKKADFNLNEQIIKNIVDTKKVMDANMKILNITEQDLKLDNNIIKLYDDEIYVQRMENLKIDNSLENITKFSRFKNCIKKILGLKILKSFTKFFKKEN